MSAPVGHRPRTMDRDSRLAALAPLEALVGTWEVRAGFGGAQAQGPSGRASFAWGLDGMVLEQRTTVDHPDAPDSIAIIALDDDGRAFTQHYFDSRGVVRRYAMTFDGRTWTLSRQAPDASPLHFSQRYAGTLSADGTEIRGAWEIAHDHVTFEKDFDWDLVRIA
jgi:hypothetical protein